MDGRWCHQKVAINSHESWGSLREFQDGFVAWLHYTVLSQDVARGGSKLTHRHDGFQCWATIVIVKNSQAYRVECNF